MRAVGTIVRAAVCMISLNKVVLGHLSKENNLAELAYETVRQEVEQW